MQLKNVILYASLILLFVGSAQCQKSFDEKMSSLYRGTVPLVYADSLQQQVKSGQIILLDTRSSEEYRVSHLPGARFVDFDDYSKQDFKDLPKASEIVVYCSVGYRSERVGEYLQQLGFENVSNLYGGIFDWKNKNFDVVNQKEKTTDSVHTYNRNWSRWLFNGIKIYE